MVKSIAPGADACFVPTAAAKLTISVLLCNLFLYFSFNFKPVFSTACNFFREVLVRVSFVDVD